MFRSRRYRYDHEQVVLFLTVLLVLGVIVLTSTVTFCLSGVFIIAMFVLSAMMIRSHHQSLMGSAIPVDRDRTPSLAKLVEECSMKLQPGAIDVFLAKKNEINAYTFGIDTPKVLVLYSPLPQVMTAGELKFIIGHEMGHVALGHTWLNTIVGGLAGIPAPMGAAVLLYAAFRWWNRMCEYSADRAGLLACGNLNLAVASLVKLVAPEIRSQNEFDRALAQIDAEDDEVSNRLAEAFQSHPLLISRINQLRAYAQTAEYQRQQAGMNSNVGQKADPGWVAQSQALQAESQKHTSEIVSDPAKTPEQKPEDRWPWLKKKD